MARTKAYEQEKEEYMNGKSRCLTKKAILAKELNKDAQKQIEEAEIEG